MKKIVSLILALTFLVSATACTENQNTTDNSQQTTESSQQTTTAVTEKTEASEFEYKYQKYASMKPEEIVAELTLEQKAAQMVQPAIYNLLDDSSDMAKYDYGSILSKVVPTTEEEWVTYTDEFQKEAVESESGIPMLYGNDDVHGVNFCENAVIFPHNIGLGAANDPEVMGLIGRITADEAKLCHMPWNFAPVVTQSVDPRWGRTYECYSSDLDIITKLSTAYTKGLVKSGIVACSKHFFGEGSAKYGTGECSMNGYEMVQRLIDRGDAELSDEEIEELLKVYQAQIDAGVQTIMVSHASLNGVKMHENKKYIMMLKEEMGFEGFIVSDWNAIQNIPDMDYEKQVVTAINAGIDMLMEPDTYNEAMEIIIDAVKRGDITEERINDAVRRIIKVKQDVGLFDDPFLDNTETAVDAVGSEEYRALAEQLVQESLVLLKNENDVLPLKKGASVYITGPAASNEQAQCGGWTIDWTSSPEKNVEGVTSILEGFRNVAESHNITVLTDPTDAQNADVVINVVGEQSYAEWTGDTEDLELCGDHGLSGNRKAIDEAAALGKPVVTCIVAGRHVLLDQEDYDSWDGVVMCYLPGSEGQGVADVLCGDADFRGKLPSPWYSSLDQIGTDECWLELGYGLTYGE